MDRTKRISVKNIPVEQVSLNTDERPIDYGHCREILIDKYGADRGEKMYDGMIDMPGNSSARFFVVAEKILREKKALHWFFSNFRDAAQSWQDMPYETLYDFWMAKGRPKFTL